MGLWREKQGNSGNYKELAKEAFSQQKMEISLSSNDLLISLGTDPESIALSELSYGGISVF
jgi:hypothetical protein